MHLKLASSDWIVQSEFKLKTGLNTAYKCNNKIITIIIIFPHLHKSQENSPIHPDSDHFMLRLNVSYPLPCGNAG